MKPTHLILLAACLPHAALSATPASAPVAAVDPIPSVQVNAQRDPEWIGYRRAYKAAAFFMPFVKTRPLIQAHLQIRPIKPGTPMEGLRLSVAGANTHFDVEVDAMGRAVLPMEKQAYTDDAVITLNRQKGNYYFSGRYSIRERDDGIYEAGMLRSACDQLLDAQRASGYRMRLLGKQCAGIKLVYPAGSAPEVLVESAGTAAHPLAAVSAHPFEDMSMDQYQVVIVHFSKLPADAKVTTLGRPLAIGTLYE